MTGQKIASEVERTIAYFSMEIALTSEMPTYSGGLGVLAGDTIRSFADQKIPAVAVSLLYRKGYFYQKLGSDGWQTEEPVEWVVEDFLEEVRVKVSVTIEGRTVYLRAWKYEVIGVGGFKVPVFLLDSDLEENSPWDRTLTHSLYGGDAHYRLCQEVILGIGGVRLLRALGFKTLERFHMNEGHASFLTLELLEEHLKNKGSRSITLEDIEVIQKKCVFTTHTPVPAGHDQFPLDLVTRVLGDHEAFHKKEIFCCEGVLNMTYLALNLSHYVNGVAKRHGEVTQHMFARYTIDSITNGVHAATWTSSLFQTLFDRYIPGWREDNFSLRYALSIPRPQIWDAHRETKKQLIQYVNRETNSGMDEDVLTLGFARRAAAYKRADLLFSDVNRLQKITKVKPLQIIYAGKAHPQDKEGKELIKRIWEKKNLLKNEIKVVFLENYDMELGKMITAGVDVWLNTPEPPLEASGTSGMKAALNGVPSLSILDGWWIEGCIEGVTGWAIGQDGQASHPVDRSQDAVLLLEKLEKVIMPLFYNHPNRFVDIMAHCIALNGSFFNTQRMVQQYVVNAYFK
jgi:starch phosphorylase